MSDLTVAIVVHNAADTIARAIRSVQEAGDYPILLVADGCTDDTVSVALETGGAQIRVEELKPNQGVGAARSKALETIDTPFAMWLDADDEILPSRPDTMLAELKLGNDLIYDGGELFDGAEGVKVTDLDIPSFMFERDAVVRCFERNWYPLLHCGFRVSKARELGFDTSLDCAEDYDFLLRAIASQLVIKPIKSRGYKYYHYKDTISRDLDKTRRNVRTGLEKHSLECVEKLVHQSGLADAEQYCILAGSALYRGNPEKCLEYALKVGQAEDQLPTYNMTAAQYALFIQASASAVIRQWDEARKNLEIFLKSEQSADALNNLGVALAHLGHNKQAVEAFEAALSLLPGYLDAKRNLEKMDEPIHLTTHPMRRQESRNDYS